MWKRFKEITGTKKGKAAIMVVFLSSLSGALVALEDYLPKWVIDVIGFVSRFAVAFYGGV